MELAGAPPPPPSYAAASVAPSYHHQHQHQQPSCIKYTQVPALARVGHGATGAGEAGGVYAQAPSPSEQEQGQGAALVPGPVVVMGEPDGTAAAVGVGAVAEEEEEDIIDPVLPDLALQVRRERSNPPFGPFETDGADTYIHIYLTQNRTRSS